MLQNFLRNGLPFRSRPQARAARDLYLALTEQARRPAFYTRLGVADRIDARFELYTLHLSLLVERLRADGERGAEVAQKLFDEFISALDDSLRELGVGDLSVAKKMRRLGEALYGRMTAYDAAFVDPESLKAVLARNVLGDAAADVEGLAVYVQATRAALAAQAYDALITAPAWTAPEEAGA